MSIRDNFSKRTSVKLAERVGYHCSNPKCRAKTVGPSEHPEKSTTIGVAAHMAAASPGGPRYDLSMTPTERCSIRNGIWLCANCSAIVDKNENTYTVAMLQTWKENAERRSEAELNGVGGRVSTRRGLRKIVLTLLSVLVIICALAVWLMHGENPRAAHVDDIPSTETTKVAGLKILILPFVHDDQVHIQTVLASTLKDLIKSDTVDIRIREGGEFKRWDNDSLFRAFMNKNGADMVVWGEYSKNNGTDYYKLKYRTLRWPGLQNPSTAFKPFKIETVSKGEIDGNLLSVVKYLGSIILYNTISETSIFYTDTDPAYLRVRPKVGRSVEMFKELLYQGHLKDYLTDSIHLYLAGAHQFLFQNDSALIYYKKYLSSGAKDALTYCNLAYLNFRMNQYADASKFINKAIELKPEDQTFRYNRAIFHFYTGSYYKTIEELQSIRKKFKYRELVFYYLAFSYYKLGNDSLSAKLVDSSIAFKPTAEAHLLKGGILAHRREFAQAFEQYKKSSYLDTSLAEAFNGALAMRVIQKQYTDAIHLARGLTSRFPTDYNPYRYIAISYFYLGQYDSALANIKRAISIESKDPGLFQTKFEIHRALNQYNLAKIDSLAFEKMMEDTSNPYRDKVVFY